jgi:hypothetical protein
MKPKETQVLGLLITLLISLIVFNLYTIYAITSYIKLTSLDVTTSFAVVDAIFYQVIKLIILSYLIFALSVEIRGKLILRERLRAKLQARTKSMYEQCKDSIDRINNTIDKESIKYESRNLQCTPKELLDEASAQHEASNLNFEPVKELPVFNNIDEVIKRYGFNGYMELTSRLRLQLTSSIPKERLESLKSICSFYNSFAESLTESEQEGFNNAQDDVQLLIQE